MVGGGKWSRQNKALNGSYINFISEKKKPIMPKTKSEKSSILGNGVLGKLVLSA